MSYKRLEELGGIQWPCFNEEELEPSFLHGRLWKEPVEGPKAVFHAVDDDPPTEKLVRGVPAAPHDRPASGLLQHRRADRRLHVAAAPRRGARALDRRRRASSASPTATR